MVNKRIRIQGVPIDATTMEHAVAEAKRWIEQGECKNILAVNPEKVIRAQQDPEVMSMLENAGLLIPDGIGVVKAAKWLGKGSFERVAGADLMPELCAMAAENAYPVFLFGAEETVNKRACEALLQRFPSLNIAGRDNGYVNDEQMPELVSRIRSSGAKIVFVALGSPRQERWMQTWMSHTGANVFQGVGGTFDVLAGKVRRAPRIFRTLNLEWLYRLLSNPRRLTRQSALPRFMFSVLKERLLGESESRSGARHDVE